MKNNSKLNPPGCNHLSIFLIALIFASCAKKDIDQPETRLEGHHQFTAAAVLSRSEALVAMQCYNNTFYHQYGTYGPSFKAYYYSDVNRTGRMDFWKTAEAIETLIDAYTINNDADLRNKMIYLYHGMWNQ